MDGVDHERELFLAYLLSGQSYTSPEIHLTPMTLTRLQLVLFRVVVVDAHGSQSNILPKFNISLRLFVFSVQNAA